MECEFCLNHEQGDTLYEPSDWDGGIGFDYIRNIKYCPLCGRMLNAEGESVRDVVRGFMSIVNNMRNPTEEERESVNKYIESISKPIGVNIFDLMDDPQTETEIARAIVHKMIDNAVIAEDAYPDLRQKMNDAVDEYEPQTERSE